MKLNIAVLPGDGIGPEVTGQAEKVISAVCSKKGHEAVFRHGLIGAVAIDRASNPYPEETHRLCMDSDAVLFGAIGDPRYDNDPGAGQRPEKGLLSMRSRLGLFANLRPVKSIPALYDKSPLRRERIEGVDFVAVRELTGGIYFGRPQGRSEDGDTAYDTCVYSRDEIERISRLAFEIAGKRRGRLCMVDKANVLATSRLWREVVQQLSAEYPGVETEYMFVDNAAMQLIQWPGRFDVILTENMFGDILTDEASVITGSLGMLPSASIGLYTSVFEPIHGSYPQVAGKDTANPLAAVLSAAMMFEHAFKLVEESGMIEEAVERSIEAGVVTEDMGGAESSRTSEVGDWLVDYINGL